MKDGIVVDILKVLMETLEKENEKGKIKIDNGSELDKLLYTANLLVRFARA